MHWLWNFDPDFFEINEVNKENEEEDEDEEENEEENNEKNDKKNEEDEEDEEDKEDEEENEEENEGSIGISSNDGENNECVVLPSDEDKYEGDADKDIVASSSDSEGVGDKVEILTAIEREPRPNMQSQEQPATLLTQPNEATANLINIAGGEDSVIIAIICHQGESANVAPRYIVTATVDILG